MQQCEISKEEHFDWSGEGGVTCLVDASRCRHSPKIFNKRSTTKKTTNTVRITTPLHTTIELCPCSSLWCASCNSECPSWDSKLTFLWVSITLLEWWTSWVVNAYEQWDDKKKLLWLSHDKRLTWGIRWRMASPVSVPIANATRYINVY